MKPSKLVYECNNEPVVIGDVVHVRNEQFYVKAIIPPHKLMVSASIKN